VFDAHVPTVETYKICLDIFTGCAMYPLTAEVVIFAVILLFIYFSTRFSHHSTVAYVGHLRPRLQQVTVDRTVYEFTASDLLLLLLVQLPLVAQRTCLEKELGTEVEQHISAYRCE